MDSEANPVALNPAQVRAAGAALRLVEQAVDEIERLLAGPVTGRTFVLVRDLGAEDRRAIQKRCDRVRVALIEACRRLGVGVVERSQRREIRGEVATLWAMLEDSKSPGLRGYGSLSLEVGAVVDEVLDEISEDVIDILRLVAESRPAPPTLPLSPQGRGPG